MPVHFSILMTLLTYPVDQSGSSLHIRRLRVQSADDPSSISLRRNAKKQEYVSHLGEDVVDPDYLHNRYGIVTTGANLPVLSHPDTMIIEMSSLHLSEVRDLLVACIGDNRASESLSRSSGNPFWCKTIANFIREKSEDEFKKSMEGDGKLNTLVIV